MQAHLLSDVEQQLFLQPASKSVRLANYVIDIIGFYVVIFIAGVLLPQNVFVRDTLDGTTTSVIPNFLLSLSLFIGYYTLIEGATKGRSLGKLITGTVAAKQDGSAITWKDALMRSLCRMVPFEPFSALGYAPWHDKWTNTTVVAKQN